MSGSQLLVGSPGRRRRFRLLCRRLLRAAVPDVHTAIVPDLVGRRHLLTVGGCDVLLGDGRLRCRDRCLLANSRACRVERESEDEADPERDRRDHRPEVGDDAVDSDVLRPAPHMPAEPGIAWVARCQHPAAQNQRGQEAPAGRPCRRLAASPTSSSRRVAARAPSSGPPRPRGQERPSTRRSSPLRRRAGSASRATGESLRPRRQSGSVLLVLDRT